MKWIRRKPSLGVHMAVFTAAMVVPVMWPYFIRHQYGLYESNISRWVWGGIYDGPLGRVADGLQRGGFRPAMILVAAHDGTFETWTEKDANFKAAMGDPKLGMMFHWAGEYQTGFWAPTVWHKAELLYDSDEHGGRIADWAIDPPTQQQLKIQAAVVASSGYGPRLATTQHIEETGVILLGYVMNTLWLATVAGLLWWCWWLPSQVRDYRAEKRRAKDLCPVCMYDVCGTPGKCPECGWGHEDEASEG